MIINYLCHIKICIAAFNSAAHFVTSTSNNRYIRIYFRVGPNGIACTSEVRGTCICGVCECSQLDVSKSFTCAREYIHMYVRTCLEWQKILWTSL